MPQPIVQLLKSLDVVAQVLRLSHGNCRELSLSVGNFDGSLNVVERLQGVPHIRCGFAIPYVRQLPRLEVFDDIRHRNDILLRPDLSKESLSTDELGACRDRSSDVRSIQRIELILRVW